VITIRHAGVVYRNAASTARVSRMSIGWAAAMLTIIEAQRRTEQFLTGQMLEALRAVEYKLKLTVACDLSVTDSTTAGRLLASTLVVEISGGSAV
jgi:hypothetical protein